MITERTNSLEVSNTPLFMLSYIIALSLTVRPNQRNLLVSNNTVMRRH